MSIVTEPQALLPLDAPLPQPRRFTLLDAAQTIQPAEDRWLAGVWANAYPAGQPHTFDPCSEGTNRAKALDAENGRPMAGAFTVLLGGSCTGSSIGPTGEEYRRRLLAAFQAVEATAVERVLATGDHHGTLGAYLADTDMERLAAGTVSPTEGLALLEDEIADAGGGGIIHVPPATATYWAGSALIEPDRQNQLRTKLGTLVAVGAGYRNVRPDGYPGEPDPGQEWAFATGPIGYIRDAQPEIVPQGGMREALDRSSNEATFIAERSYVLVWVGRQDDTDDNHVQAGVLIDRL